MTFDLLYAGSVIADAILLAGVDEQKSQKFEQMKAIQDT